MAVLAVISVDNDSDIFPQCWDRDSSNVKKGENEEHLVEVSMGELSVWATAIY